MFQFLLGVVMLFQPSSPTLEPADCLFENADDRNIECFELVVPEEYDNPTGNLIRLPIAIIRADEGVAREAIVYTAGGPGSSSLNPVTFFRESDLSQTRDIILFEQRGTPFSDPALACPQLDDAVAASFQSADSDVDLAERVRAAEACFLNLSDEVDLGQYHTATISRDLNTLYELTDYDGFNLFGISYSTRLILYTMQTYPAMIRSVVLNSALPLDAQQYESHIEHFVRAVDVWVMRCAEDSACRDAYPDLEAQFYNVIAELNAEPVTFSAINPTNNERVEVELTGFDIADGIFNALYDSTIIPYLPFLIDRVDRGDIDALLPLVESGMDEVTDGEWGLFYSVQCHDEVPFNDPVAIEADRERFAIFSEWRTIVLGSDPTVCEVWDVGQAPPDFRTPTTESTIPTFVLAGEFDPITPPQWGQRVAERLPNAYYAEFPYKSHSVFFASDCAQRMVASFYDDPSVAPENCTDEPFTFITTHDVYPTSLPYQLDRIVNYSRILPGVIIVAGVLLSIVQVILVVWFRTSIGRFAAFVAALNLVFAVGMGIVAVTTSSLMLGFGIPADAEVLAFIPPLSLFLTLILGIELANRWHPSTGYTTTLVFIVASVAFNSWVMQWL